MAASNVARVALLINQGATYRKRFTWLAGSPQAPVDLTGFKATLHARADYGQPLLIELTTENGGIVLGGVNGSIDLFISDIDTTSYTWDAAIYDLELTAPGGDVTRLVSGSVTVSPDV